MKNNKIVDKPDNIAVVFGCYRKFNLDEAVVDLVNIQDDNGRRKYVVVN